MLGAIACLSAGGCGAGGDAAKPTATLTTTVAAQAEFQRLLVDWGRGTSKERIALEPRIENARRRHKNEPIVQVADALLAWVVLERGDAALAAERARAAKAAAKPGTARDLAQTVEGAALRRQGRAEEALALLSPLVSKLIDPYAQGLLNQEIVEAALAARQWQRALELMGVWLREAPPEEHDATRLRVEKHLERVPPEELRAMLSRRRGAEVALAAEEELEIRKLVARRLAAVAKDRRDAELAQHLLSTSAPLLGGQGEAIAELAVGAGKARVEARTVGLLLSLRSDETRRRGAAVAAGVAHGLGLPGSAARLVSRDDHGDASRIDEALASLSADGASIVIAGTDAVEATAAARFAEARQIPVLLLQPPADAPSSDGKAPRFSFVVGSDPAATEDALAAALVSKGATPIALVTDAPDRPRKARPEITSVQGCDAVTPLRAAAAAGLLLDAPVDCARDALAAFKGARHDGAASGPKPRRSEGASKLRIAAGLDAAPLPLPPGSLVASAGLFPVDTAAPPAALQTWMKTRSGPPSFWSGLGHDAAVLAWVVVQTLPAKGTEDPAEVTARRYQAAMSLANAQADLWTTEAKGFGGGRVLPRAVTLRERK